MPVYTIGAPDGRKIKIEAPDEATAIRGATEYVTANPKQEAPAAAPAPSPQAAAAEHFKQNGVPGFGAAAMFGGMADSVPVLGPYLKGGIENLQATADTIRNGGSFADNKANAEAGLAAARAGSPVANATGSVIGTAAPFGIGGAIPVAAKALGMSGGLASQIGFGAGSGALIGGADTLARGGSLQDAGSSAALGGALGGLLPGVAAVGSKAIAPLLKGANKTALPEISDLYAAKDAAYKLVDDSGVVFSQPKLDEMIRNMMVAAKKDHINPELHKAAFAKLRDIASRRGPMTLTQLDQLRQEIYRDVVKASDGDGHFGKQFVDAIDDVIETSMEGNSTLLAARKAHSTVKKSEALQNVIEETQRRVAATGSGGNIDNALRQAMNSLLKNKKLRWTPEEHKMIANIVLGGGKLQDALRVLGKLSPSGNGLMAALGIGATATNPLMAAIPAVGLAAKTISDRATKGGIAGLTQAVRTGAAPLPRSPSQVLLPGGALPLLPPKQQQPIKITVPSYGLR